MKTMCNIPEVVLQRQLMIESIPSVMIISALFVITVLSLLWWISARDKLSSVYSKTALISWFIIFIPSWYHCSFLVTQVATTLFNPEYAVLVKFANGCPSALLGG